MLCLPTIILFKAVTAPLGARPDIFDERLLWATGAFVATLLVGAVILALVERWRKKQMTDETELGSDNLSLYRLMYQRGELSQEEYVRIRDKIAQEQYNVANKEPSAESADSEPTADEEKPPES